MTETFQPADLGNATVVGTDGKKIGKVGAVYVGDSSGVPEFVTVKTGLIGSKETFVPLSAATHGSSADEVAVPYDSQRVKDAPSIDAEGHLSPDDEMAIYRYYGLEPGNGAAAGAPTAGAPMAAAPRDDAAAGVGAAGGAPNGNVAAGEAITRSEERLRVGTETVETGQARLHKYVVTENVTQTVPVSREHVRVEHEPITDANRDAALSGNAFTEADAQVTLHEERPVVSKETVPVERVRLTTEVESGQAEINEQVRKERIDEEIPDERTGRV